MSPAPGMLAGEEGFTPRENAAPVRALLADPPEWLPGMLAKYREDPDRFGKPTCTAIAAHLFDVGVFDTPDRWREVEPILARIKGGP